MKKTARIMLLIFMMLFTFTGCGKKSDSDITDKAETEKKQETEKDSMDKDEELTPSSETQQPVADANDSPSPVNITVFYSNDDATAFVTEDVEETSLSPEAVMQALITKGAVAVDVKVMNFKTVEVDGKNSIELDLNSEFAAYVKNLGTTGEYYAIGSVCNTYLNAYDCQQIKITIDGQDLVTGHAEYPGYMTAFE